MPSREELVAALSMGAAPQQAMDGRWQRLMQELLAQQEEPPAQTQQDIFVHGTPDEGTAFLESLPPGAASMRPYEPTRAEGVGNWIYDTFSGMGLPGVGDKMRQTAMEESPLAIAQGAQETTRALGEGDYGAAAMAGAGALLSAAPIPVPGAKGAVRKGIRAYHGSPHDFDKFSMEKIGTGEGAQAYGHGLYFAENEGVAKSYKAAGPAADAQYDQINSRLSAIARERDAIKGRNFYPGSPDWEERSTKFKELGAEYDRLMDERSNLGRTYEVDIEADPEHFLDWDKPLSEHPPNVQQAALGTSAPPDPSALRQRAEASSGATKDFLLAQADYLEGRLQSTGEGWHGGGPKPEISERLREAGIPGIRYLDQGSRTPKILFDGAPLTRNVAGNKAAELAAEKLELHGTPEAAVESLKRDATLHPYLRDKSKEAADLLLNGRVSRNQPEGTSNYVVFDDALINILRKYGMAGMIGTPLGLEMAQRLMSQEQGQPEGENSL